MMIELAAAYGMMSLSLYTGAFKKKECEPLARILICGTVSCLAIWQLA